MVTNSDGLLSETEAYAVAAQMGGTGWIQWRIEADQVISSPEVNAVFGFTTSEPRTLQAYRERIHPDDLPAIDQCILAVVEGGPGFEKEVRVVSPEGRERWVAMRPRRVVPPSGDRSLLLNTVLDITERKEAELKRQASEEQLAAALEFHHQVQHSTVDGLAALDMDCRYTLWNQAMAGFTGLEAHEVLGQLPEDIWPAEVAEMVRATFDATARGHVTPPTDRHFSNRKTGRTAWCSVVWQPLRNLSGEFSGALCATREITERKLLEDQIREMNRDLEQKAQLRAQELMEANAHIETSTASMAHDLRETLRCVCAFAESVLNRERPRLGGESVDELERVVRGALRMDGIVEGLLTLNRIARATLRFSELDISATAAAVVHQLRGRWPEHPVRVAIEPGLRVMGDPELLGMALSHLLENAWKFTWTTESPEVQVWSEQDVCETQICITDNGMGFDPRYAHRLFLPFERLAVSRTGAGHGVGLAIVKRVMERHRGKVTAERGPDQRTTFRLHLAR